MENEKKQLLSEEAADQVDGGSILTDKQTYTCEACGTTYTSSLLMHTSIVSSYGMSLCPECVKKRQTTSGINTGPYMC